MRLKAFLFLAALMLSVPLRAQVEPGARSGGAHLGIGGGIDYWKGDYGHIARFGPSVWATDEFWHGIGVIAEGHSMTAGGSDAQKAYQYKYYSGEGGVFYTYHRWHRFEPFAKGELGFASLSFPHHTGATYTHDTRTTWAIGGGFEYKLTHHVAARFDYTYDNFPNFYSAITHEHHTLSPNGVTVGGTWHFR